ncbi:MAG: hypothetical protein RLY71_3148 [Pseudomonadota bacterium]|jgi:methanogenic corrinoid protein MtbC1/DNA-binding transcriptional MerR regulator
MSDPASLLPSASPPPLTIAAVERDTRISKDTLRVWERRYGFPAPQRDSNGERLYPVVQVHQLRHIKRLMDAGHRPGRIVGLPLEALEQLGHALQLPQPMPVQAALDAGTQPLGSLLLLLRRHEMSALRRSLTQALLRMGLGRFVTDLAAPLMVEVGRAWSQGELEIFEEHLCSETLETVLRAAMASAPEPAVGSEPRVLLATLPTEAHGLGLLMADALFCVEGCHCMNLGTQTPLRDVVLAARAHRAQIVALSFSVATNVNQAIDNLAELRAALADEVEIWVGSASAALHRRGVAGVLLQDRLDCIGGAVARWRAVPR